MTGTSHFSETLEQGSFRAQVRAGGEQGPYTVHITGPRFRGEEHSFHTRQGALAFARIRLFEVAPESRSGALSSTGSAVEGYAAENSDESFHRRNPAYEAVARVSSSEHEAWGIDERFAGGVPNPKSPEGYATFMINSENPKTGIAATSYAANPSCPTRHNSSRPCPFLGSGCYAEQGPSSFTLARNNHAVGGKTSTRVTPEQIARDEAASILDAIETIKKNKAKGRTTDSEFHPLRLHVVGDCVTNEAARILSEAASKWPAPVWTYTHAWRDVSRSSWGKVSVFASCETIEDVKKAMDKGYAACIVQNEMRFKSKTPHADKAHGVRWSPCRNETDDRKPEDKIRCGDFKETGCKWCWHDKQFLSARSVVVFRPHGSKAAQIINAINRIDGTKVAV